MTTFGSLNKTSINTLRLSEVCWKEYGLLEQSDYHLFES